jgi:hypothetical protein
MLAPNSDEKGISSDEKKNPRLQQKSRDEALATGLLIWRALLSAAESPPTSG